MQEDTSWLLRADGPPELHEGTLLMDLSFLSEFFGAFSDLFSALNFFSGSAG
ncbi:hypothetical protein [Nocardia grenadensis]|uniref:hypothetical protein n=1 Tax=Nocardia grenadensis TaxID=931537 RepID=UPI003D91EF3C